MLLRQMDWLKNQKNLGTLQNNLHDTPENWSNQVRFFLYALNTHPLSHLHVSSYEIFFHTQQGIPLNF